MYHQLTTLAHSTPQIVSEAYRGTPTYVKLRILLTLPFLLAESLLFTKLIICLYVTQALVHPYIFYVLGFVVRYDDWGQEFCPLDQVDGCWNLP